MWNFQIHWTENLGTKQKFPAAAAACSARKKPNQRNTRRGKMKNTTCFKTSLFLVGYYFASLACHASCLHAMAEGSLQEMYAKKDTNAGGKKAKRRASFELIQKFVAKDAVDTYYSPAEMRALVDTFRTHCDNKENQTMSSLAFQQLFDIPPKLCQKIFSMFDENKSGTLVRHLHGTHPSSQVLTLHKCTFGHPGHEGVFEGRVTHEGGGAGRGLGWLYFTTLTPPPPPPHPRARALAQTSATRTTGIDSMLIAFKLFDKDRNGELDEVLNSYFGTTTATRTQCILIWTANATQLQGEEVRFKITPKCAVTTNVYVVNHMMQYPNLQMHTYTPVPHGYSQTKTHNHT